MSCFTTPLTREFCVYSYYKRRSWLGRFLGISGLRHRLVDNGLGFCPDWLLKVGIALTRAHALPPGRGLWIVEVGLDGRLDREWRRPTAEQLESVLNGFTNEDFAELPPIKGRRPYLSVILKPDRATDPSGRLSILKGGR